MPIMIIMGECFIKTFTCFSIYKTSLKIDNIFCQFDAKVANLVQAFFFAYEHQIKYLKGLRGFNHYFIGIKWQFMSICLIWFPPTAKFVWCLVKSLELVIRRKHLNVNSSTLLKTRACPIEKFNKIAFSIGILSINLQTRSFLFFQYCLFCEIDIWARH